MNSLATELNGKIKEQAPSVHSMLSRLGLEMYMPKGIITQGAQAKEKAYKFNATLGIATNGSEPMYLECIYDNFKSFAPGELFTYAPTTGLPELRKVWKEKIISQTPSLNGKQIGLPVVTNALTHGLSIIADLFCNEGDYVVIPDKFWGNYRLTFGVRTGGLISTYETFNNEGGFNVEGLLEKVRECGKLRPKVLVVLNFPNNPTGYTITEAEAEAIKNGLKEIADSGIQLVCISDDAYYGMFYGDCIKESFFGRLAGISKNLLAIKLDGATKEMFVWGFRVGFITFAATEAENQSQALAALEQKVAGTIRGSISNCAHPSQSAILKALKDPKLEEQMQHNIAILKRRADKAKECLLNGGFEDEFEMYPFNSGYFLCLKLKNIDSEALRLHLLDKHGVGAISTASTDLRIAFSSVEEGDLEELFAIIYKAIKEIK